MQYTFYGLEIALGNVHIARSFEECQAAVDVHFSNLLNRIGDDTERRTLAIYRYELRQPSEDDMLELLNEMDECGHTTAAITAIKEIP